MNTTFAERLVAARHARQLTQGDLARESRIAATQLSRYETGRAVPRKLAINMLANALAVDRDWLETGEGEMGEYAAVKRDGGLHVWLDRDLAERLANYAHYQGMTLDEAILDILDAPLSVYATKDLPKTPEKQAKLRQMIRVHQRQGRVKALAGKAKILPGS